MHGRTNTLSLEDPEIFKYPVLYIIEVSWWQMTDREAENLRAFLDKGGFVIVDDFKTAEWRGGRGWEQFADNMRRVNPKRASSTSMCRIRSSASSSTIDSLDIFPQAYNAGRPIFRGLFEDNDPAKRLQMFVNYNTDISQFWEWSGRGLRPVSQSNEAYKLGVNAIHVRVDALAACGRRGVIPRHLEHREHPVRCHEHGRNDERERRQFSGCAELGLERLHLLALIRRRRNA